jgi:hypothetical protein
MAIHALPAQAYTAEVSPWSVCLSEKQSNQVVEESAHLLNPLSGATVVAGTPVTFSAQSGVASPMMFAVASSPSLLSNPDIDSGPGSLVLPEYMSQYAFTSAKAAATPRTIYWTASFTRDLRDCEGPPVTFTVPPRTLTVLPSPAEEATAAKKREEENAVTTGGLSLDGVTIDVQSNHDATVKLTCTGIVTCSGKLKLTAIGTSRKGKRKHTKTETLGTAIFSITADRATIIKLALNGTGRNLLSAAHGHLNATLAILKTSPVPTNTQTQRVYLERRRPIH